MSREKKFVSSGILIRFPDNVLEYFEFRILEKKPSNTEIVLSNFSINKIITVERGKTIENGELIDFGFSPSSSFYSKNVSL